MGNKMRLKPADGPLSIHNGNTNDAILNSPKRINTLQNSNIINFSSNLLTTTTTTLSITDNDHETTNKFTSEHTVNNINNSPTTQDKVQWSNPSVRRELTANKNNRNCQLLNINNTLAASLRAKRHGTASSICSESSPDDSLLDFEDCGASSAETSPQDEERAFDPSDSESSEESNLSHQKTRGRGIVNPNYPGFQHLAHTLNYTIKASSDTDFTDDDLESDALTAPDPNSLNNNNNNDDDDTSLDYPIDHIDSVNRLDSVENIQKVFYEKSVFNDGGGENKSEISDESSTTNPTNSDEEITEINVKSLNLNIKSEESSPDVVGDFGGEIEQEFGRISLQGDELARAVVQELDDTIEKISETFQAPIKYQIELNITEPLITLSPVKGDHLVLDDSAIIKTDTMGDSVHIADAFLSNAQEQVPGVIKLGERFNKQEANAGRKENNNFGKIDSNRELEEIESQIKKIKSDTTTAAAAAAARNFSDYEKYEKFNKEDVTKEYKEKDEDSAVPRKKEKIDYYNNVKKRKDYGKEFGSLITFPRREFGGRSLNRRSVPMAREKKRASQEVFGNFDVYNIETAMPKIDLEAIESHLRSARDEERRAALPHTTIKMFDNLFSSIKNHTNNLTDIVKSKSRKLAFNINTIRSQIGSKPRTAYYTIAPKEDNEFNDNDYLSPRAYSMTTFSIDYNSVNENMEWFPYVPRSYDESNIVDRFIKVITINDDCFDRRTDREEIRRRLAMGSEDDYYTDRPGRKPSLQARLQSGMNLQICFMNETVSDTESPNSDSECPLTNPKPPKAPTPALEKPALAARPASLPLGLPPAPPPLTESDFFARQARLQTEARMALAQAKEMARMQMEIERQRQKKSPITEMVRHSLEKVGIPFPEEKRRLSRQILTEMNVAQLQVIVNDLHTQIEVLNESLVKFLMNRDDLHMGQDSMLVDIEDLTRYLGAKEQVFKEQTVAPPPNNNLPPPSPAPSSPLTSLNNSVKPHFHRIASLVKK